MRTALWETSAGALAALLNAGGPLTKADLYTITLANGTVHRWSGADIPITGNSQTWALGPGLRRSRVRFVVGVEVDSLNLTLTDVAGTTLSGQGLMAFIAAGGLDNARLQLDRAFWRPADAAPVGAVLWFAGRVADVPRVDRREAQLVIKSDLELLDVMVPRDVLQAGCLNTLYDSACGKDRAALTVASTTTSTMGAQRISFGHTLPQADGWFDLGVVTMTSGANAGFSRTVKRQTTGTVTVLRPWPFTGAPGDSFTIYPGCDKTQATCTTKFANLVRFRGFPYVPVPETIL